MYLHYITVDRFGFFIRIFHKLMHLWNCSLENINSTVLSCHGNKLLSEAIPLLYVSFLVCLPSQVDATCLVRYNGMHQSIYTIFDN